MKYRKLLSIIIIFAILQITPAQVSSVPDIELLIAEDSSINLKNYEGEVFLLLGMTTECSSCAIQTSYIKDIAESNPDLNIISVAVDPNIDTVNTISLYKEENDLSWTIAVDTTGELRIMLQINTYPQTMIFDNNGELVRKWVGIVDSTVLTAELSKYTDINDPQEKSNPLIEALTQNLFFVGWILVIILAYPVYKLSIKYLSK